MIAGILFFIAGPPFICLLQYTKQILFFQHHIIHPAQKPSSISAERLCYSVYISTDYTPGMSSCSRRNPLYRNAAAWQCTARFYRIAFLPLEIDLSHSDFPLCQPVVQTHKIAFAVCQTDRKLGNLHFFTPLDTAQQFSMRADAVIPAAPTIGRKPYEETSVISAAPSETIMCTRTGAFHACLPLHNDQPHQTDHLNIFWRTQAPSE